MNERKKKQYEIGQLVAYRLGKHDQDIVNFLNGLSAEKLKVSDVLREGLRLYMQLRSGDLSIPESTPHVATDDQYLLAVGKQVNRVEEQLITSNQELMRKIEELQKQLAGASIHVTDSSEEISAAIEEGKKKKEEPPVDPEEIASAINDLMDWD